jgi:hypothetical protein
MKEMTTNQSSMIALGLSIGALAGCFNPKPFVTGRGNDASVDQPGTGGLGAGGGTGGAAMGTGGASVGGGGTGGGSGEGGGSGGAGDAADTGAAEDAADTGGPVGSGGTPGTGGASGTGGANCLFDEQFTSPNLGLDWNPTAAGQAPTYTIVNGRLVITDTAFSATPSRPATPDVSWIYDVDQDLGNQMARRADIGTGDFVLDGTFQWESQLDTADRSEAWLAGVAVTDSAHHIKAMVNVVDPRVHVGMADGLAMWGLFVRPDAVGSVARELGDLIDHTVRFRIKRTAGTLTFTVNDQPVRFNAGGQDVDSAQITADIAAVAIVTVRLGSFNGTLKFGRFYLDQVRLCRP